MIELLLIVLLAVIAYSLYRTSINHARYFEDRNLKYTSTWQGIRTLFGVFLGRNNFFDMVRKIYNAFPNES